MRYLEIEVPPRSEEPLPWWCRLLKKAVPAANPDIEQYYGRVRTWWLEVDDNGLPSREIGFDADGHPIILGPVGNNYGFLVDGSDDWSDSDEDSTEAAGNFDRMWAILWPTFKHLQRENSQQPD